MSAGKTIRRIGFRKWYERELLQSHANLVLLLLATLGLLGCAEAYSPRAALAPRGSQRAALRQGAVEGVQIRILELPADRNPRSDPRDCHTERLQ
mgnify:CR=1 FL=1